MGAVERGLRNPFRNKVRTTVVVVLLSLVLGLLAVMVQSARVSRRQLGKLEAEVRTSVELREAGAFGTGGFGGDKPVGEKDFTLATLEKVKQVAHANHIARIDEYVYQPQIDPTQPNAYAMLIGLRPGAVMRAIGEVDYESARIVAGRGLGAEDAGRDVAVVGRLYARQRLGLAEVGGGGAWAPKRISLDDRSFEVVGVYATGNDFGDNHVFIPLEAFRAAFHPGQRLSKIFVTVDSVANVEAVVADLKATIPEADVVTAAEQVSTARTTLGGIAAASLFGSLLLFAIGGVLVVFVMVRTTTERVREIGTLKALGASNREIVGQLLAEVFALVVLAGVGSVVVAALSRGVVRQSLGLGVGLDAGLFLLIVPSGFAFAALGSLYPIVKGARLSPVEAMRSV